MLHGAVGGPKPPSQSQGGNSAANPRRVLLDQTHANAAAVPRPPTDKKGSSRPGTQREGSAGKRQAQTNPGVPHTTPITPANAFKLYDSSLSDYEQSEIFDYPQIYFLGNTANKAKGSVSNLKNNHGYDDDRGDYGIVLHDHIAFRYEILSILGKGSFGQVCKCYDYKNNTSVACKIIRNKKRFHHQALVEVKILETLRDHDADDNYNIIRMLDYFYFRNHLCITFELLSINLYEFIKNNNFQGLSLGLIRRFAIQLLTSLKYLHRESVIHCDLKPENILLKSPTKSGIKIIDFGSSCFEHERIYTYIQSRFYRSPEVILGISYGRSIDMWSFGCILAELYTGYPLFPGENETEQLACIMEIMDVPPKHIIELSTRKRNFFDSNGQPRIVPNSRGKKRRPGGKDLVTSLRCNDAQFISFLEGFLRWDPRERFTPDDGLRHEWILEAMIPATFRTPIIPNQGYWETSRHRRKHHEAAKGQITASSKVQQSQKPSIGKEDSSGNSTQKDTTGDSTKDSNLTGSTQTEKTKTASSGTAPHPPVLPPISDGKPSKPGTAKKEDGKNKSAERDTNTAGSDGGISMKLLQQAGFST
eukprot:TRINITY_DN67053_c6_g9_i1.p1 TRINITY_DN67053_c6_g9~~TRINITY_DN67053_c6_g9_i1.p1  ORF type:complete len:590 (+),score=41.50 TRINITY_DN67053_c6_g9_i1:143-1912(+)